MNKLGNSKQDSNNYLGKGHWNETNPVKQRLNKDIDYLESKSQECTKDYQIEKLKVSCLSKLKKIMEHYKYLELDIEDVIYYSCCISDIMRNL